jgi:signal transduction histidine kinase
MALHMHILTLLARLTDRARRQEIARELAQQLGAENLIIFINDPELDVLLPAPGFPQTLRAGRQWRAFIAGCEQDAPQTTELPCPYSGRLQPVMGIAATDGCILVLLGGSPSTADMAQVQVLLPLLGAAFSGEQALLTAAGHAAMARATATRANTLAESLDSARRELQQALTEAKQARQRSALLAEVSALLADSLDYETTLAQIARLALPNFADWCIVDTIAEDGSLQQMEIAHVTPAKIALIQELRRLYPPDPGEPHAIWRAIRNGRSELASTIPDAALAARACDVHHLTLLREVGITSHIVVPLQTRDRILGAITFVMGQSGRHYEPNDLVLAEGLARRAAVAMENARLYQDLQQALHVREQFLTIAAHELKTPLTSLLGNAQLIQRRAQRDNTSSTRDMRALQVVVEQATRLNVMITSLLDITRIESGQLTIERKPIDLCRLIRRVIDEIRPGLEQHKLTWSSSLEEILIEGDALRLEQVLQNLIGNAVKYSPQGGLVTVHIERRNAQACVMVSDQGIGIPQEALTQLFQRFYRAKNVDAQHISGVGIGLFVVKEIVDLHGGEVTVESNVGRGSTFTVWLPSAEGNRGTDDVQP